MSIESDALNEMGVHSDLSQPHRITHYLYLPGEGEARDVALVLRNDGYETLHKLDAEGIEWLVLATHHIVPSETLLSALRERLEILAASYDGEYDGWEAEVCPDGPT